MALNDNDIWARYYCSLSHLYSKEGNNCKWVLEEPFKV
jgi:hypothetical protein